MDRYDFYMRVICMVFLVLVEVMAIFMIYLVARG